MFQYLPIGCSPAGRVCLHPKGWEGSVQDGCCDGWLLYSLLWPLCHRCLVFRLCWGYKQGLPSGGHPCFVLKELLRVQPPNLCLYEQTGEMDKTYALNSNTTHVDKNLYSAILCSSSMPASWRRYLARRLMRAQRFPARPKPPLCLHKLFHNLFTTFLDLFSCYPFPWLFKSCTFTHCWGQRESPCPEDTARWMAKPEGDILPSFLCRTGTPSKYFDFIYLFIFL